MIYNTYDKLELVSFCKIAKAMAARPMVFFNKCTSLQHGKTRASSLAEEELELGGLGRLGLQLASAPIKFKELRTALVG